MPIGSVDVVRKAEKGSLGSFVPYHHPHPESLVDSDW